MGASARGCCPAVTTPEGNTTATVTVPKDAEKVTVTIPTPEKPGSGTVAVIINADGTKTVVKNSVATEDGMTITLAEGAKLEIIDTSKTFGDADGISDYAKEAMTWAVANNILQGSGNNLNPQSNASRGEVAIMLQRFVELGRK